LITKKVRRTTNPLLIAFRVPRGRDLIWTGKRLVIKLFAVEVEFEVEIGIEISGGGDDRRVNLSRGMVLREVGSMIFPAGTVEPYRAHTIVSRQMKRTEEDGR
jgi:hypothetical protein